MKIRQARLEDLDRIVEIELENFSIEEAIPRSVLKHICEKFRPRFWLQKKKAESWGI